MSHPVGTLVGMIDALDLDRRVCGIALRYVLVDLMLRRGPMTVTAMLAALDDLELVVPERRSKVVSDVLRTEVRRGRVVRLGRGRYGVGRIPRSTEHRIRVQAERIRSGLGSVAVRTMPDHTRGMG